MLIKFQVKSVLEQNLYKKWLKKNKWIRRNDLNNSIPIKLESNEREREICIRQSIVEYSRTRDKFVICSPVFASSNDEEFNDYP